MAQQYGPGLSSAGGAGRAGQRRAASGSVRWVGRVRKETGLNMDALVARILSGCQFVCTDVLDRLALVSDDPIPQDRFTGLMTRPGLYASPCVVLSSESPSNLASPRITGGI